ncbi:MAG: LCP family protein [Chloroflexi bacterium]|nr:LCP family protein [Chloroflexota bacterium]
MVPASEKPSPSLKNVSPPGLEAPPPKLDDRAPERRRRWWLAVPVALSVYLFLVFFTIVQPISALGLSLNVPIPGISTAQIFGLPDRPFTVMIVGLDIRPTQDGPSRTDSILLLQVDADGNRAGLLSIPRDSMMLVSLGEDGFVRDRVNTAFVYNWTADDDGQAPEALAQTIERNLGIHVDYRIVFDQRDAADIIDAAGGLTVDVRSAFGQADYSDDDVNVVPQFFEVGRQHLNGYEAVAYGRIRQGSSDLDRIRRQQQVAEGLVAQLGSLTSITKLPGVWRAYSGGVETDLGMRQSAGLFSMLKRIGTGRIVTRSLGDAAVSCASCQASILQLLPSETARVIAEAFDDAEAGRTAADLLVAAGVTP